MARLERAQDVGADEEQAQMRFVMRAICDAQLRHCPDLALVERRDTDAETYADIEQDRRWARGQFHPDELRPPAGAVRAGEEFVIKPVLTAREEAYLNGLGKTAQGEAAERAVERARRQLGLPEKESV